MRALLAAVLLLSSVPASAAPTIEYQGRLTGSHGSLEDGVYLLRFELFSANDGRSASWADSRYVRLKGGLFQVRLGKEVPIPEELLRSAYRLVVRAPEGTGWRASRGGPMEVKGLEPSTVMPEVWAPEPEVPEAEETASPEEETEAAPGAEGLKELLREVERFKKDARRAKEEAEASRRRLDALERKMRLPEGEKASRIHVVRKGETLRSISVKVYGSPEHWIELYRANDDRIQRGGELIPGQLLLVPELERE